MRTTIDRSGRVVVPREIRARLRLLDGGDVELVERDGVIEILPVPADVRIVHGDSGPVAVPASPLPSLTDEAVARAVDESRR